jgi:enterochelin esterase family protein
MKAQSSPTSPRAAALKRDLEAGAAAALDAFWRDVQAEGTPIIEGIAGDDGHALVTFLWRPAQEYQNVVVYCPLEPFVHENVMERMAGTDLWYKTYRVARDVRTPYWFCPEDSLLPWYDERDWGARSARWTVDPLNPRTVQETPPASELVMPQAPPMRWSTPRPEVVRGEVTAQTIQSVHLGGQRPLWVYTPPGYRPDAGSAAGSEGESYPLLVLFDGWAYINLIPTPTILDNLLAEERIPPMVAVLVGNGKGNRVRDLGLFPPHVAFLAEELLPWARERFRVATAPARTTVGGSSLGGVAAAYAALQRPDLFGQVLSQSGAFHWKREHDPESEWLARHVAATPVAPVRFSLRAGRLETWPTLDKHAPSLLTTNRHLRNLLRAKGYDFVYGEVAGGHDYRCWEAALPEQLMESMGGGASVR